LNTVPPNKKGSVFVANLDSGNKALLISRRGNLLELDISTVVSFLTPIFVSTPNVLHVFIHTFPKRITIPPSLPASLIAFIQDTETALAKRHWSDVYSTENSHT
jgi:hypothetical protein